MEQHTVEAANVCSHMERLAAASESFVAQRDQLNDLKREARLDGLNILALNPLVEILGTNPHDRGRRVLQDLFSYAIEAGAELEFAKAATSSVSGSVRSCDQQAEAMRQPDARVLGTPRASDPARQKRRDRIAGAFHGLLGLSISGLLLWLLS